MGAVVAASVATAIVVGTIVASLPPSCTTVIANGIAYQNCGGTYYQPRYQGSASPTSSSTGPDRGRLPHSRVYNR